MVLTNRRCVPRWLRAIIALALTSTLVACAYVPFDAPRTTSHAFAASELPEHPVTRNLSAIHPTQSAYYELSNGTDALGARLRMIENARHSLDIATFLIKPDTASGILMHRVYDAANRGVRVRILLDDVFTTAADRQLAVLDAHPNIEMRVFNPTSRNAPKPLGFLWDFGRVNRRMHIKTFVADSAMAIIGGRNFADEYFELKPTAIFADYDLAIFGPDARALDPVFDNYWNDRLAVPLNNLLPRAQHTKTNQKLADLNFDRDSREFQAYQTAINTPYLQDVSSGKRAPFWGQATIVVDTPDKLRNPDGKGPHLLGEAFFAALGRATDQVTLITPYFVPEDYGARFYMDLAARGVRVRIVTNSLASTNHAYVHGGYARHRKALLRAGVELYELRFDALTTLGLVPPDALVPMTLHSKLAVIDDARVLVGSLNLDPRSIKTNAEIGLFVHSPAYARAILSRTETNLAQFAYRVTLDKNDALIWTHQASDVSSVQTKDPDATVWQKLLSVLPQIFGLEKLT